MKNIPQLAVAAATVVSRPIANTVSILKNLLSGFSIASSLLLTCSLSTPSASAQIAKYVDIDTGTWSVQSNRDLWLNGSLYMEEKKLNTSATYTPFFSTRWDGTGSQCLVFRHTTGTTDPERQRSEYYVVRNQTGYLAVAMRFAIVPVSPLGSAAISNWNVISQFQQHPTAGNNYIEPFVGLVLGANGPNNFNLAVHIRNDQTYPSTYVQQYVGQNLAYNTWYKVLIEVKPNYSAGAAGFVKSTFNGQAQQTLFSGNVGYSATVAGQDTKFQETFGLYRSKFNNSDIKIYFDDYTAGYKYLDVLAKIP